MRKMRKGFTLVELLVVVAIVAIITTTMSMTMVGGTAKAKASAILANIDAAKSSTTLYYAKYMESTDKIGSAVEADTMLGNAMSAWATMKDENADDADKKETISYTAVGKGATNWTIKVDFANDAESKDLAEAFAAMRAFKGIGSTIEENGLFGVNLLTGTVVSKDTLTKLNGEEVEEED